MPRYETKFAVGEDVFRVVRKYRECDCDNCSDSEESTHTVQEREIDAIHIFGRESVHYEFRGLDIRTPEDRLYKTRLQAQAKCKELNQE